MSSVDEAGNAAEEHMSCLSLLPRLGLVDREEDDGITNPSTQQSRPTTTSNVVKMAADLMVAREWALLSQINPAIISITPFPFPYSPGCFPGAKSAMHVQSVAHAFALSVSIICASFHYYHVYGFSPISVGSPIISTSRLRLTRLCSETSQQQQQKDEMTEQPSTTPRLVDMKMSEIKAELIGMNVSFADCFDRESMEKRLLEARDGSAVVTIVHTASSSVEIVDEPLSSSSSSSSVDIKAENAAKDIAEFDRASTLIELRQLSVRELKVKLSELKVRWGTMIEKEEMVQALCNTMEERYIRSKNFSRSGILIPGSVTDVDENTLMMELGWSDVNRSDGETNVSSSATSVAAHTQILLDVYATWCGPCQFMAPLLSKAAEELGPDVRVVKLDSDKYPRISGALKGELFKFFLLLFFTT